MTATDPQSGGTKTGCPPADRIHHLYLELSSRVVNIEIGERALIDLCATAGFADDDCYWAVTALREALANAIVHGNQQDPGRRVVLVVRIEGDEVFIRVEDEGEGFNPKAGPDPTDPANLLEQSGRGIFYMQQFMTRVEFSLAPAGGTVVEMTRRLGSETRS